jgi:hypothetical protein
MTSVTAGQKLKCGEDIFTGDKDFHYFHISHAHFTDSQSLNA